MRTPGAANFSARDSARAESAIGEEDDGGSVLDEVTRGELGHLSGSDEEDGLAVERTEDFAGEVDGYRCDGDGAGADLRLAADFFRYGEGALQESVERACDCTYFAGDGVGLLDLAEDLRLADDHGVE